MNKDAGDLIGDLLIQIDRISWHFHPDHQFRKDTIQKFLILGYMLVSNNANRMEWKQAYQEAQNLWEEIVNKLPYAGYSATGISRKQETF
jgi:hypothetical protein